MLSTTTLKTLSALVLSCCISVSASAQYPYGNLQDAFSGSNTYSHQRVPNSYRHDSYGRHDYSPATYGGYADAGCVRSAACRGDSWSSCSGVDCRHGSGAGYRDWSSCPSRGNSFALSPYTNGPQRESVLRDDYRNYAPDSRCTQPNCGHSHQQRSWTDGNRQRDIAPRGPSYGTPPQLPGDLGERIPSPVEFPRGQQERGDLNRIESQIRPSLSPGAVPAPGNSTPKRIDTAPPLTL